VVLAVVLGTLLEEVLDFFGISSTAASWCRPFSRSPSFSVPLVLIEEAGIAAADLGRPPIM